LTIETIFNIGFLLLISKNHTIVAACNNDETGVGPSIASANQVCKPTCADLPIAPINNNKSIKFNNFISPKIKKKLTSLI
jgi:hypothetical protein